MMQLILEYQGYEKDRWVLRKEKHETIATKNKLGLCKADISHKARCKGELQEWAELQWKEF